ncbi:MAG: hypothetical protein M3436_17850 [Pseudomonadota bacterium]|nr:hypothetical protein [Pseudomonadota bacterium]
MTDELTLVLRNFPALTDLSVGSPAFTARQFPALANLRNVDVGPSHITIEGLTALCACPRVEEIKIPKSLADENETRLRIQALQGKYPHIEIWW